MSSTTATKPDPTAGVTGTPSSRRRVLLGALALLVVAGGAATWVLTRSSDSAAPYTDPRAVHVLTLCDADGHRVTSGSTVAAPFVARAVGSTPVAGGASQLPAAGATLMAYQPREGLEAGEWSGQQLTASSTFSSANHPIGQATVADPPLADFLTAFPARWDGLVQLRLYVSTPTAGLARTYDAVSVRVEGDTWSVVGTAGTASCTAGTATSLETTTNHQAPATH